LRKYTDVIGSTKQRTVIFFHKNMPDAPVVNRFPLHPSPFLGGFWPFFHFSMLFSLHLGSFGNDMNEQLSTLYLRNRWQD